MVTAAARSEGPERRRLYELVMEVLRDHIGRGALPRGLIVQEGSVAEAFGVGRTPVAMALDRLEREGVLRKRRGHGYMVAAPEEEVQPVALSLEAAGLVVPDELAPSLRMRKLRSAVHPKVQSDIAAHLVFGRFRINVTVLAEQFGVSRTVAQEVLTALEGVGFVRHESNGRWYTVPLSYQDIRDNYELRWLLEPQALVQAAPLVARGAIEVQLALVEQAQKLGVPPPELLNDIEVGLHGDIVLKCANRRMRAVLTLCQLPVIVSYRTVVRHGQAAGIASGVPETLAEHRAILLLLLVGRIEAAARELEDHIRHGFKLASPHFLDPPPLDPATVPPYLVPEP